MDSPWIYHALPNSNSIRLLQLEAGLDGGPVQVSLLTVPELTSAPVYHALSYCWGDADDTSELMCNGFPIRVTRSLESALRRLRHLEVSTLIWADALCINQDDVDERNQQILIMPQIYRHASRVEVWLGPERENSSSAIEMIRIIGEGCCLELYGANERERWFKLLLAEQDRPQLLKKLRKVRILDATKVNWKSFWLFYQAEWFFRAWVIQEVQQCSNVRVLCGEREVEWHFVALAASWIRFCQKARPGTGRFLG